MPLTAIPGVLRSRSVAAGVGMLCLGLSGCGDGEAPTADRGVVPDSAIPEPPTDPPNLILVSIDSLRPDHLGCYGYERDTSPFLDQLAEEGVRFESAVSSTSWTLPAHAALFTGLYDSTHGLVDNGLSLSPAHVTLAEVLQAAGYETAGFFGGPYLHPVFGMGQGFDTYVSCMTTTPNEADGPAVRTEAQHQRGNSHRDVTGPRTVEAVRAWAEERDRGQPFFLFVHLWDVHYDFIPPEPYDRMFDPDYEGSVSGRLMSDPSIHAGMPARDLEHVLALYDGEIRFTDDNLRALLEVLGELGFLENAMLAVTADHGEEFFEHKRKGHNKHLFDEVLKVPLIVRWPGVIAPRPAVESQVRLIDLMPTFLEVAHAPPMPVAGRSLWRLLQGGSLEEAPALAELMIDGQSQRALRTNEFKVYRPADDQEAYLLRLDDDPSEQVLIPPGMPAFEAQRTQAAENLRAVFERAQALQKALGGREAGSLELGESMRAQLEAMGYLTDTDG